MPCSLVMGANISEEPAGSSSNTKVCAYAVQTKETWDFWCNKTASPGFSFLSQLHSHIFQNITNTERTKTDILFYKYQIIIQCMEPLMTEGQKLFN